MKKNPLRMFVFLEKIGQMRLAIITDVSKNGKLLVYYAP